MKNLILAFAVLVASCQPAYATVYKVTGQMPEMFVGLAADTKPVQGVHPGARFMETDTNNLYIWNGPDTGGTSSNWIENYEAVTLGTRQAGERNEDSTTGTDYSSVSQECKQTTVDTSTDSTTVYSGPAILEWVYVNTALSAHTVVLKDNTTAKVTLPASLAAGSSPNIPGGIYATSFIVDPDDSSTGNITVCYRPLDSGVNW